MAKTKKSLADKIKTATAETDATPPHVIVVARAGTGKTTTLVEGLKKLRGLDTTIIPSPQQAAVWDQMSLTPPSASVAFVAFNKSIATELQQRVPAGCVASTMHSMGFKAVQSTFGRVKVTSWRVQDIISEILEIDIRELRKDNFTMVQATEKLVDLCKMNLVGLDPDATDWEEELEFLAAHYDVELNGSQDKVFELVPKVLDRCKEVDRDKSVDFADMIWLPVALNLSLTRYDLLLVDEAQDLNRCQQALAKRAGKRLILCGDPKQAIYGFAGADADSMPRMERELGAVCPDCKQHRQNHGDAKSKFGHDYWACECGMGPIGEPGCVVLPLTVTRRCGRAIVREANAIVPDFEAHESNPQGKISKAAYNSEKPENTYRHVAQDGDRILCRVNAPLVSQCFRFLKEGRKANILGRDVGAGLTRLIDKLKASDVGDLIEKLDQWYQLESQKESKKRNPSEPKLIALQDKHECLMMFCEDATTIQQVKDRIEAIFTDDQDKPGVILSSIHKAKGLEADRVFLLEPEGATVPHPMARSKWQIEQEHHLRYVAITRAREELVYVS